MNIYNSGFSLSMKPSLRQQASVFMMFDMDMRMCR